jgi:hypothetical protein
VQPVRFCQDAQQPFANVRQLSNGFLFKGDANGAYAEFDQVDDWLLIVSQFVVDWEQFDAITAATEGNRSNRQTILIEYFLEGGKCWVIIYNF